MALSRTAKDCQLFSDWSSPSESQEFDQSRASLGLHPPQTRREGKKFIVFFKLFPPPQTENSEVKLSREERQVQATRQNTGRHESLTTVTMAVTHDARLNMDVLINMAQLQVKYLLNQPGLNNWS